MPVEWGSFQQNNYGRTSATKPFLKRLAGRRGPVHLGGHESRGIVIGTEHNGVIEFLHQNPSLFEQHLHGITSDRPRVDSGKRILLKNCQPYDGRMSATKPFLKRLAERRGRGGQDSRGIVIGIEHNGVIEFVKQNPPMHLRACLGGLPLLDPIEHLIFVLGIPSHRFSWTTLSWFFYITSRKILIEKKSDDVSMPVEWGSFQQNNYGRMSATKPFLKRLAGRRGPALLGGQESRCIEI